MLPFPGGSVVKNLLANAGDTGDVDSVSGLRRFPREGHGNPLQYSCLGNFMDRGAWQATVHGVAKSCTWLSTHALKVKLINGSRWDSKSQRPLWSLSLPPPLNCTPVSWNTHTHTHTHTHTYTHTHSLTPPKTECKLSVLLPTDALRRKVLVF